MKDSIHKKLTEHIRKTVGRYELPYEPGSWEEFQRQRRRRKQRPVIWFRYALAACLLLGILGVPVWLYVGPPDSAELAVHHPKTGFSGEKSTLPTVENRRRSGLVASEQTAPTRDSAPISPKGDFLNPDFAASKSPLGDIGVKTENVSHNQNEFGVKNSKSIALTSSGELLKTKNKSAKTDFSQYPNQSFEIGEPDQPNKLISQSGSFERIKPRSIKMAQRPLRPLGLPLKLWAEQPAMAKIERSETNQKPVWGVSLAPQSVYATGSSPSVGVGGGLFSEIPINRRFSLSTGLSMAQQKLGTTESGLVVLSTVPHLVSTNIRLTAVDLPVNIRFRPGRWSGAGFYAEAGLSSVAFLNERYDYTYEQTKPVTIVVMGTNGQEQQVTQYVTSQETKNRSEPAFQKIYWGRIINLSIGVERRLGAQFRLSAEPYLKYPVGPFTRENLMLGSGGVSLRLGFQSGR